MKDLKLHLAERGLQGGYYLACGGACMLSLSEHPLWAKVTGCLKQAVEEYGIFKLFFFLGLFRKSSSL